MERIARRIEREGAVFLGNVDIELHVRIGDADVGAFTCRVAEIIDNGVLDLIGNELRMAEFVGEHDGIHSEGRMDIQVLAPVNLANGFVDAIRILGLEMLDGLEHTHSCAEAEIGTVHHGLVACERHHASTDLHIVGT